MNRDEMLDVLREKPVVSILRGVTPEEVVAVSQALADNGIRFVEITMNSPQPLDSIRLAAEHFAGSAVRIGAGTVLTPDQVDAVAAAGGEYIISPDCNPAVIQRTKEIGLLSIPGVFTPTEALTAVRHGADFLKLFPAGRLGAGYIKDLKAVVPAEFIATGGVGPDNKDEYLQYAVGLGIGSSLYKAGRSPEEVAQMAVAYGQG